MVFIKHDISEIESHDLHWMLADAIALVQMGRNFGAILILLCTVDALAARAYPDIKEVRKRFQTFLESVMRRPGRPQVWNIFVPPRNELLPFEYILYKYLRNPIVHEGARLELDHPAKCSIRVDWQELRKGIKVDGENNQVILGGELIIDVLVDAVIEGMRNI